MDSGYKIIFHGELVPGYNIEQVKQNIAALYKVPVSKFDSWFSGRPVTIKENIDYALANKYKIAFEKAGAICIIKSTKQIEDETLPQQITCPKCGTNQPYSTECKQCGIVIKKYIEQKKQQSLRQEKLINHTKGVLLETNQIQEKKKQKTNLVVVGSISVIVLGVMIGAIVLFMFNENRFPFRVAPKIEVQGDQKKENLPNQLPPSPLETVSQSEQKKEELPNQLIPYTIINRDEQKPFKVAFDIQVDLIDGRLPTKEELGAISRYLYSQEPPHERTFVLFYLPEMEPGLGAFATAHHDPDMQVQINELMIPVKYRGGEQYNVPMYTSISEMIEDFGDYSESNGTFQILQESPVVHIQIAPTVVENDLQEVIHEMIKRAMLDTIYKTFIHTHLNIIKLTVTPMELDFQTQKGKYLSNYSKTIQIEKSQAVNVAKSLLKVNSLDELVETEKLGEALYSRWTQKFENSLYNDSGEPTLDRFFLTLYQVAQK